MRSLMQGLRQEMKYQWLCSLIMKKLDLSLLRVLEAISFRRSLIEYSQHLLLKLHLRTITGVLGRVSSFQLILTTVFTLIILRNCKRVIGLS